MRKGRLLIALAIVVMGLISYWSSKSYNPFTGETQHIALTTDQEIAMGLQSAPQMAEQFGGPYRDPRVQAFVQGVGEKLVASSVAAQSPYQFSFTVLEDPQTVNAFALPGGPIFITVALLQRLENEAQLAGVLGHEIGHVIGRHSAEHIAKSNLAGSIVQAVGVAASDGYSGGGQGAAAIANMVAQMVNLKYGREDELESDSLGIDISASAGYNPEAMIRVMEILAEASGGAGRQPEFLASHPDPGNRIEMIRQKLAQKFPGGVPATLTMGETFE